MTKLEIIMYFQGNELISIPREIKGPDIIEQISDLSITIKASMSKVFNKADWGRLEEPVIGRFALWIKLGGEYLVKSGLENVRVQDLPEAFDFMTEKLQRCLDQVRQNGKPLDKNFHATYGEDGFPEGLK